jgi:hypothetical protein
MPFDITFQTSFNLIVSGASGTGKTTWVRNLIKLKNQLFSTPPSTVIWFYSSPQKIYDEMEQEGLIDEFHDASIDLPTLEELTVLVRPYKDKGGSLVVFDDVLSKITPEFEQIFCNLGHHENASLIFLTQNLMYNNKIYRTLSLNTHYFVLMKNDRGKHQVSFLSRQACPDNPNYIMQAFNEATKNPFDYLILDFRATSPQQIKLRSHIFPHQFPVRVYLER